MTQISFLQLECIRSIPFLSLPRITLFSFAYEVGDICVVIGIIDEDWCMVRIVNFNIPCAWHLTQIILGVVNCIILDYFKRWVPFVSFLSHNSSDTPGLAPAMNVFFWWQCDFLMEDDHIQWHHPLIRHNTNFWPCYWSRPYYRILTFHLIVRGFHRTFATGAACQQKTLTPRDTWSCSTLGFACVLMLRPISPELILFPDFWVSNIPRYFCFASKLVVL